MKLFGSAAVLAGGKSSRMGFDKQLMRIRDERLMDILLPQLLACFDDVLVVTNRLEYYAHKAVRAVPDSFVGMGPLAGIHAALLHSASEYTFVIACDMPHISAAYVRYMQNRVADARPDACVTKSGEWIEPFHAFYGASCLPFVRRDLEEEKTSVFRCLKKARTLYIEESAAKGFEGGKSMFINLNTKEDLEGFLETEGKS